jgi:hypothetical protein
MLSAPISSILRQFSLSIASLIGIATLAAMPAAANPTSSSSSTANSARGVVTYSTPNFTVSVASELSSSYVISGVRFNGDVTLTASGAQGSAELSVTAGPDQLKTGYGGLQQKVIQQLSGLDISTQQGLDAYVSILKAAAGADGLEDVPIGADPGVFFPK